MQSKARGGERRGDYDSYKSPVLTAVPQSLEKRLAIMRAIGVLSAQNHDDQLGKRQVEIVSIRRELAEVALALVELRRECDPRARSYT